MKIIHYYNQNGEHRTVEFRQVIKQWVEFHGGTSKFLKEADRMSDIDILNIQFGFLGFFKEKYKAILPEFGDIFFQPEIFQPEIYHQAIFNLKYEHNTRPGSGSNVIIYIVIVLALFGLISMCS